MSRHHGWSQRRPVAGSDIARPRYITVTQTADRLTVSKDTVRRLIDTGQLPAYKIGALVRIYEDDLKQFLDERVIAAPTNHTVRKTGRAR